MGCSTSKNLQIQFTDDVSISGSRHWQRVRSEKEAISSLMAEGSLNPTMHGEIERSHLELRALLDYPIGREFMLQHIDSNLSAPFLMTCYTGWLDIQSFDAMVDGATKKAMAYSLLKKYVKDSVFFGEKVCTEIETAIKTEYWSASPLNSHPPASSSPPQGIFKSAQSVFFQMIHDHIFVKLINTPEYDTMCATLRRKYNRVKQNDFWYHELIGQGGFGLVARVSKKTTGVQYAMKLQRKSDLLRLFGDEPWRVELEKAAFASCRHPFIVELYFAFQTESLVAMVMSLGNGRDLSVILRTNGPLSIEQVTFYSAETTSALSYLHDKGFVYRDLKPGNILLDLDGHIRLIDFGAVCDVNGKLLDSCRGKKNCKSSLLQFDDGADTSAKEPPLSKFWRSPNVAALPLRDNCWVSDDTVDDHVLPHQATSACEGPDLKQLHARARVGAEYPHIMHKLKQRFYELSDASLLRHSLACNFNYDKTVVHIEECLLWRQTMFTFKDMPNHSSSGTGCFFYTHGFDIEGHPLLVATPRLMISATNKDRNLDEMVRWWVYMLEVAIQRLPPHLEQFTILGNRSDMSNRIDFEFASRIFPIMDKYYPFRRHKLLVYPMSGGVKAIGGVLKFIAGKQAGNIHFLESLEELRAHIPNEYIPAVMGGACTYEFNPVDYPLPAHLESCGSGYLSAVSAVRLRDREASDLGMTVGTCMSTSPQTMDSFDVVLGQTSRTIQQPDAALINLRSWSHIGKVGDALSLHKDSDPGTADNDGTNGEDIVNRTTRAKSIVGTYNYMAPEMIILLVDCYGTGFTHTGYTKAVDWWSLGVTIYRLLTALYPFESDIPNPSNQEEFDNEGSDRYSALLQEVNYRMFGENYPHVVDIISQLLIVNDMERLGAGPDGSNNVSAHKFFADINWVELEQKKSKPPPLPQGCDKRRTLDEHGRLNELLRAYDKTDWVSPKREKGSSSNSSLAGASERGGSSIAGDSESRSSQQMEQALELQLDRWDYTSPAAVLVELEAAATKKSTIKSGILQEMLKNK